MDDYTKEISAAKSQRTEAWKEQRLGKVTASKCKIWMGRGRKKDDLFSQTALSYLYGVLAEILTGSEHLAFGAAIEWGEDEEANAVERYKEVTGKQVRRIGYIEYPDNNLFGGSADGLIEPDGILEVKCPFNPANHIRGLVTNEPYNIEHIYQVQANLLFTGRKWCDYATYDPRILDKEKNIKIIRLERDAEIIEAIKERTLEITEMFNSALKTLGI